MEILARGDVKPDRLIGSWAGALGPTQFMPTTFKRFAVDFDHAAAAMWSTRSPM